jgi:hypothetical protein
MDPNAQELKASKAKYICKSIILLFTLLLSHLEFPVWPPRVFA